MRKLFFALILLSPVLPGSTLKAQTIGFTAPDTVCVGTPVNITNQSTGASYYWQFCNAPTLPTADFRSIGNPSTVLYMPVFAMAIKDGSNYYVFCVNHIDATFTSGNLLRFDYGSSLLNTPAVTDLGSLGVMPLQSEQLAIKKDGSNWYGIMVGGGTYTTPQLITISFGASLSNNTPTAVNHGDIGSMWFPIGLHVFQESGNWYAYVANRLSSTITRISYGTSLANTPTGANLSNIGNLDLPTTCRFIKQGSKWHAYIPNYGNSTLTRLDFGTSLLNTPTGTNLGTLGGKLNQPTDLIQFRTCNELSGYITNNGTSHLLKISFAGDSATGNISATALGNLGNLAFPHSISESIRMGDTLYSFIPNVDNNTITLMAQPNCTQPGISSSIQTTPPAYAYSAAGTYVITLYMDEGLPTQTELCKSIVVVAPPIATITQSGSILTVSGTYSAYQWYRNGVLIPGATSASYTIVQSGDYYVKVVSAYCTSTSNTIAINASSVYNIQGNALSIYPNPTADVLFIHSRIRVNAVLRSMDGRKAIEQKNVAEMRLGALAAGIYMLTVTDEYGRTLIMEKLVKQQ